MRGENAAAALEAVRFRYSLKIRTGLWGVDLNRLRVLRASFF
jgi:hypothetical protein